MLSDLIIGHLNAGNSGGAEGGTNVWLNEWLITWKSLTNLTVWTMPDERLSNNSNTQWVNYWVLVLQAVKIYKDFPLNVQTIETPVTTLVKFYAKLMIQVWNRPIWTDPSGTQKVLPPPFTCQKQRRSLSPAVMFPARTNDHSSFNSPFRKSPPDE